MSSKKEIQRAGLYIEKDLNEGLQRMANKAGISKNKLMINILKMNLASLECQQKIGVLDIALILRDMGDYLKRWPKVRVRA